MAGVLAGPLLPASVAAGTVQPLSNWLTRAAFFVALGQAFALFVSLSRRSLTEEIARLRIERDVLRGLDFGEFRVLYQPIVKLDTERVVGVEALVRWKHAVYGALEPTDFIVPAESSNAIVALGDFVLEETCRQMARWKRTALSDVQDFHVAVNVSTRQLEDPSFRERIAAILRTTGMKPAWLHLEVTETALIADIDTACARLRAIKQLGVRVDIDDFGTGYSSLAYLHRLPADVVKIDRSFVTGLNDPGRANVILELITNVASRLAATTLAEGVESLEDATRLRDLAASSRKASTSMVHWKPRRCTNDSSRTTTYRRAPTHACRYDRAPDPKRPPARHSLCYTGHVSTTNDEHVVAAFDFDGTLSTRDNVVPFLHRVAGTRGTLRAATTSAVRVATNRRAQRTRDVLKAEVVQRVFAGRDARSVDALARDFARDNRPPPPPGRRRSPHRKPPQGRPPCRHRVGFVRRVPPTRRAAARLRRRARHRARGRRRWSAHRTAGRRQRARIEKARRLDQWIEEWGEPVFVWAYGNDGGDRELWARADRAVRIGRRAWLRPDR